MLVGVAGGSGSGKTTFSRMLQANLGDAFCGIIAQDSYYRDLHEQFDHDGGSVNFDHPDSIEFPLMIKHLLDLKKASDILIPNYDFATHRRLFESTLFPARPVVVVDGILVLALKEVRELFDMTFFIETQEDLRFQRRLHRDVRERARSPEGVREQFYNHVKPMHDLFVEPSSKFAHRVISGERSFGPIIDEVVFGLKSGKLSS